LVWLQSKQGLFRFCRPAPEFVRILNALGFDPLTLKVFSVAPGAHLENTRQQWDKQSSDETPFLEMKNLVGWLFHSELSTQMD
jgi:hypothetical protein